MTTPKGPSLLEVPACILKRYSLLLLCLLMIPFGGAAAMFQEQDCIVLETETPVDGDLEVQVSAPQLLANGEEYSYLVKVTNHSTAPVNEIEFDNQLLGDGDPLSLTVFQIIAPQYSGFAATPNLVVTDNRIYGEFSLDPGATGEIRVSGPVQEMPPRNVIENRAYAQAGRTYDNDVTNNRSSAKTLVQELGKDIVISKTIDNPCYNKGSENGNLVTFTITNTGTEPLDYNNGVNKITVSDALVKAEGNITLQDKVNWKDISSGNSGKVSFETLTSGVLQPGESISVSYRVTYNDNYYYGNRATVVYGGGESNTSNNTSEFVAILDTPDYAPVVSNPVYYLIGENSQKLEAQINPSTQDSTWKGDWEEAMGMTIGYNLNWYYSENSTTPVSFIKPNTGMAGSTTYYVSQSLGTCEGPRAPIEVIVLAPAPGSLAGDQVFCRNTSWGVIGSTDDGVAGIPQGYSVSYRWQSAEPGTEDWTEITAENAVAETYRPGPMSEPLSFRRSTVLTRLSDGKCVRSGPTEPITVNVKPCAVTSNPMMPSRGSSR